MSPGSRKTLWLTFLDGLDQATLDRWPQLEKLASSWGGALCVAVYVKTEAEIIPAREKMLWLHSRIEAQSHCRLHLQMVTEEGFRSQNDALSASYPVTFFLERITQSSSMQALHANYIRLWNLELIIQDFEIWQETYYAVIVRSYPFRSVAHVATVITWALASSLGYIVLGQIEHMYVTKWTACRWMHYEMWP